MQYVETRKPILSLLLSLCVAWSGALFGMNDTQDVPPSLSEKLAQTPSKTNQQLSPTARDQREKPLLKPESTLDQKPSTLWLDEFFACLLLPKNHGAVSSNHLDVPLLTHPLPKDERGKIEEIDKVLLVARHRLQIHTLFIEQEQAWYQEVHKRRQEEAALKSKWCLKSSLDEKKDAVICAVLMWQAKQKELEKWQSTEKIEVNQADQERLSLLDPALVRHAAIRQLFQFDATRFPESAIATNRELDKIDTALNRTQKILAQDDALAKQQIKAHKAQSTRGLTMQQTGSVSSTSQPKSSGRARRLSVVEEKG